MKWYSHENEWESVCCFWGDGEVKQHLLARGHRLTGGPDTHAVPRCHDPHSGQSRDIVRQPFHVCHATLPQISGERSSITPVDRTVDGTVMCLFWRWQAKRGKGIERKGSRIEERFVEKSREFIRSVVGLLGDIRMVNCSPSCSQASSWRPCICCSNYTAAPETNDGMFFLPPPPITLLP